MRPLPYTRPWSAVILLPYSTPPGTKNPTGHPDSEISSGRGEERSPKTFFSALRPHFGLKRRGVGRPPPGAPPLTFSTEISLIIYKVFWPKSPIITHYIPVAGKLSKYISCLADTTQGSKVIEWYPGDRILAHHKPLQKVRIISRG